MGAGLPYITEAIAQGVENNPKPKRVIVMSPAIVVEKWAREIQERVPNVKTFIIKSWLDFKELYDRTSYVDENQKIRFKEPETFEYYIVSSELPKTSIQEELDVIDFTGHSKSNRVENNYEYLKHGMSVKEGEKRLSTLSNLTDRGKGYKFKCPKCGGGVEKAKKETKSVYSITPEDDKFFYKYNARKDEWTESKKKTNSFCKNFVKVPGTENEYEICGHSFWQPKKNLSKGMRKVSPIWYLNKRFPRGFFKYLILDEAHEFKAGNSKLGESLGQLINHTEKQILLTGTLMGGMASDIYYLLAKLTPDQLKAEGIKYGEVTKFNKKYGLQEVTVESIEGLNNRKRTTKQKPGINPHLFPVYLMENATFLELNDMGYALPKYEEIPELVDLHPEIEDAYLQFTDDFISSIYELTIQGEGNNSFGFSLINNIYQYADIPSNFPAIELRNESGRVSVVDKPQSFDVVPDGEENTGEDLKLLNKYNRLVDNIENELDLGRKSLIYVNYTGETSVNRADFWLYDRLKELGFNVGVLTSGKNYDGIKMPKKSTDREAWLKEMMEKHDWDVLITNPRLVKVGLDLLDFPNIHFYQMNYSTYDYMQASRRSWRIRQDKPVKVYTYAYTGTVQEMILQHMAAKIDTSLAVQGRLSEEGLRTMAETGGLNQLAKDLINNDIVKDTSDVYKSFQNKNQTFEQMQSVEFQDYDNYEMNPIEGGIEKVKEISESIGFVETKEFSIKEVFKSDKKDDKVLTNEKSNKVIKQKVKKVSSVNVKESGSPSVESEFVVLLDESKRKEISKKVPKKDKIFEGQSLFNF